ncbi:transcription elongation factor GreA [Enterobacterales bacterium endosymbiont of Anomoneura mori]|uniref:transcription elongation factor GreA n=1 Tax=Enterobacterales bacterium endosymbiont of Anomoneura mori TaxID=3132096 RepID=UPI00399CA83B
MKKILITISGYKKIKKELNNLKNIKRPKIIKEIIKAREYGDLKENYEYHAAREQQNLIEKKIKDLELKLLNSQILDITKIKNTKKVTFGSTVTILNLKNNNKFKYRIVCNNESDIVNNLISINSPIGKGLLGNKVNDILYIKTPIEITKYKILKIEYI